MNGLLKHVKLLLISTLIGFLILSFTAGCGGPESSLLFGSVLNSLASDVSTIVEQAGEAGRGVVIEAGAQADLTIQNAKIAYEDSLNKTLDKLDATTTHKLQEIQTMVNDLKSQVDDTVDKVTMQAQQITNTLPFANTQPQLTTFSPRFYAVGPQAQQLELEMKGNFVFAQRDGFRPSLQIAGTQYDPAENTTQSLKFLVTPSSTNSASNKITLTEMKLSVPYEKGTIFKTREVATYKLLLGNLPPNPGRIVLQTKYVTQHRVTQHIVFPTPPWKQYSSDDDHDDIHYTSPQPEAGWKIVDNSVRFVVDWSQGDEGDQWSKRLIRTQPFVEYSVTTTHHRFGTSGKVDFHFEYDIEHFDPVVVWVPTSVGLTWGQSSAFQVEPNGWKILFDSFDGHHQEIVGPQLLRYLEVRIEGAYVVLSVPAANDIKY